MSRTIDDVRRFVAAENGLATFSTTRRDGTVQSTLINAGTLAHPLTGAHLVGAVIRGGAVKLIHLRERPWATLHWRHGWDWIAVEGGVELIGPDDELAGFDPARLPRLLRDVFTGAGGTHDDWPTYDRVMVDERRAAVLVTPSRIYGPDR